MGKIAKLTEDRQREIEEEVVEMLVMSADILLATKEYLAQVEQEIAAKAKEPEIYVVKAEWHEAFIAEIGPVELLGGAAGIALTSLILPPGTDLIGKCASLAVGAFVGGSLANLGRRIARKY